LSGVTPPDRTISVPDFAPSDAYSRISVALAQGTLSNFHPRFDSIGQRGEQFAVVFKASAFTANYGWVERYHWVMDYTIGRSHVHQEGDATGGPWSFAPSIGMLTTVVTHGGRAGGDRAGR